MTLWKTRNLCERVRKVNLSYRVVFIVRENVNINYGFRKHYGDDKETISFLVIPGK